MTYEINKKPVSLREFSRTLCFKIFKDLESYEAMSTNDIAECEGDITEIFDYLSSIMVKLDEAKATIEEYTDKEPYERLTGHEMGVCGGRV